MAAEDERGRVKASTLDWQSATEAPPQPRPPAVGRLPGGWRYVLLEELGRGGMGVVHAAYDRELGRRVALKLLHPRHDADAARERLLREAQALARLQHRNVVTVYDAGTYEGEVFVAMELVAGESMLAWLRRRRRGWREVVAAFRAAGRGLEAAHAAGLVHRDFKPDNVLIGADGAVRVADFGLARAADTGEEDETPSGGRLGQTFTRAGAIAGTPAYLAPEVLRGGRGDARSDQYAFGVSLHEALSGELPYRGGSHEALLAAIEAGDAPPPPAPRWVRAIVQRALARDAAARYPSMTALLAELDRDPARRRRRLLAAGAAAAVAAAAVWAARRPGPACEASPSAWDDGARVASAAAFAATGLPYAADAHRSAAALLDAYAARLAGGERAACRAVGRETSQLVELRASCLARRRGELAALVDLWRVADAPVVDNSVRAAGALSEVDACGDAAWLLAPSLVPREPAAAAEVTAVRDVLVRCKALHDSGKYAQAVPIARAARERAAAVGYKPLEAEALFYLAAAEEEAGNPAVAEGDLRAALFDAEAGKHDEIVARAAGGLAMNLGVLQARLDEGWGWAELGLAAVERMGAPPQHEARARFFLGILARKRGQLADAERQTRRAIQLYEAKYGHDSLLLASPINSLGGIAAAQHHFDEAEAQYTRAYDLARRLLGEAHPDTSIYLANLAEIAETRGDLARAVAIDRRLVRLREEQLGPEHPRTAEMLRKLSRALLLGGAGEEAALAARRSVAIFEKAVGPDHARTARARLALARALSVAGAHDEAGREAARAAAAFEQAKAYAEASEGLALVGEAALAAGRAAAAAAAFDRARALADANVGGASLQAAEARCRQADAWRARGDARRALAAAEGCFPLLAAAANREPLVGLALLTLGQARLAAGHPAAARAPLERAVALLAHAPDQAAATAEARAALARAR